MSQNKGGRKNPKKGEGAKKTLTKKTKRGSGVNPKKGAQKGGDLGGGPDFVIFWGGPLFKPNVFFLCGFQKGFWVFLFPFFTQRLIFWDMSFFLPGGGNFGVSFLNLQKLCSYMGIFLGYVFGLGFGLYIFGGGGNGGGPVDIIGGF